ncbi:hypothetical protein NMY22_g5596 [Coprinellus aureogranulatus]|nr:hypothetical protein NMY22_g5596 [Coprinellus aureogranulatus]
MPYARPGWTCAQSVELRVAGVDYLEAIDQGTPTDEVLMDWFGYFLVVYNIPPPTNYTQVVNYQEYVAEYKQRIFRTIRWHAFQGRRSPPSSEDRRDFLRHLRRRIIDDIREYENNGVDLSSHRPPCFQLWFQETIRAWALRQYMTRGSRSCRVSAMTYNVTHRPYRLCPSTETFRTAGDLEKPTEHAWAFHKNKVTFENGYGGDGYGCHLNENSRAKSTRKMHAALLTEACESSADKSAGFKVMDLAPRFWRHGDRRTWISARIPAYACHANRGTAFLRSRELFRLSETPIDSKITPILIRTFYRWARHTSISAPLRFENELLTTLPLSSALAFSAVVEIMGFPPLCPVLI